MEEIIYREAVMQDLAELIDMWINLRKEQDDFSPEYKVYKKDFVEITKEYFSKCILSNEQFVLIAESNSKPAGYIMAEVKDFSPPIYDWKKEAQVKNIFVKPEFRGKGIGKELISRAENFYGKDIDMFTVMVNVENKKAIKFYESSGLKKFNLRMYKLVK